MKMYPSAPAPAPGFIPLQQMNYGPESQQMTCPFCSAKIKTTTKLKATTKTHLMAGLLCLCLCWFCCCCPYCITSCNNVNHTCPNCKSFLGTYVS